MAAMAPPVKTAGPLDVVAVDPGVPAVVAVEAGVLAVVAMDAWPAATEPGTPGIEPTTAAAAAAAATDADAGAIVAATEAGT